MRATPRKQIAEAIGTVGGKAVLVDGRLENRNRAGSVAEAAFVDACEAELKLATLVAVGRPFEGRNERSLEALVLPRRLVDP